MKYIFLITLLLITHNLHSKSFESDIVSAAMERTKQDVRYDGAYVSIEYPNGDVPSHTGVCTDVVIRTYRVLGSDLQKLVHEDIKVNFSLYPSNQIWGLKKPDGNIDHRRVPNLQVFFKRHGTSLSISNDPKKYKAGDLVTWMIPGNSPHIGIVSSKVNLETGNPLIIHNIGRGPEISDMLFSYEITGHYRYVPAIYNQ